MTGMKLITGGGRRFGKVEMGLEMQRETRWYRALWTILRTSAFTQRDAGKPWEGFELRSDMT